MATEIWKSQFAFIRKSQLVSEKSTQRFAQLCPTPWALMPKVVGYLCPSYRSFVPIVSVIHTHRIGRAYPCSWSSVLMFAGTISVCGLTILVAHF